LNSNGPGFCEYDIEHVGSINGGEYLSRFATITMAHLRGEGCLTAVPAMAN